LPLCWKARPYCPAVDGICHATFQGVTAPLYGLSATIGSTDTHMNAAGGDGWSFILLQK
jgi:hypothetical protein